MAKTVKYPHIPGNDKGADIAQYYRNEGDRKENEDMVKVASALLPYFERALREIERLDSMVYAEVGKVYSKPFGYTPFASQGNNAASIRENISKLNKVIKTRS